MFAEQRSQSFTFIHPLHTDSIPGLSSCTLQSLLHDFMRSTSIQGRFCGHHDLFLGFIIYTVVLRSLTWHQKGSQPHQIAKKKNKQQKTTECFPDFWTKFSPVSFDQNFTVASALAISSALNSSSAIFMASSGLSRMAFLTQKRRDSGILKLENVKKMEIICFMIFTELVSLSNYGQPANQSSFKLESTCKTSWFIRAPQFCQSSSPPDDLSKVSRPNLTNGALRFLKINSILAQTCVDIIYDQCIIIKYAYTYNHMLGNMQVQYLWLGNTWDHLIFGLHPASSCQGWGPTSTRPGTPAGRRTKRLASLVNIKDAVTRRIITKKVLLRPNLGRWWEKTKKCLETDFLVKKNDQKDNCLVKLLGIFILWPTRHPHAAVVRLKGRMSK